MSSVLRWVLLPALGIALLGCDDDAPFFADNSSKVMPLQQDLSRLVVYREPHFVGSLAAAHITVGGSAIGDVDNASMMLFDHAPGRVTVSASSPEVMGVYNTSVDLSAGTTYYLRVAPNVSVNTGVVAPDQSGAWTVQWVNASSLPKLAGLHDETVWQNGRAVAVLNPVGTMGDGGRPLLQPPIGTVVPPPLSETPAAAPVITVSPAVALPPPAPKPVVVPVVAPKPPAPAPVVKPPVLVVAPPPPVPVPPPVKPQSAPPALVVAPTPLPPAPPPPALVEASPPARPPVVAVQAPRPAIVVPPPAPPVVVAAQPAPVPPPPAPVVVASLTTPATPVPGWGKVLLPYAPEGPIPNNAEEPVVDGSRGIPASTQSLIDQMMH